ncbi:MAG: L-histidine N(alpha)-methyltransferase [Acidobacteriota bacterium]
MEDVRSVCSVLKEEACRNWTFVEDGIWSRPPAREEVLAERIFRTLTDQPRWLEARFLYDERGSELFERISALPEYYLTRTENTILRENADGIMRRFEVRYLVEIGAGSSVKTRHLIEAMLGGGEGGTFVPIDVSRSALQASRDALRRDYPDLRFLGLHGALEDALPDLDPALPKLVLFLGSSLGNFPRTELVQFLSSVTSALGPDDLFLLGVDGLKERGLIERAYNDPAGITRAFILNVFNCINALVDGDFDPADFEYAPVFNESWQQMEMWVRALRPGCARFRSIGRTLCWEEGDPILVEVSRKFESRRLAEQITAFGVDLVGEYADAGRVFSLLLFRRV